MPDVLPALVPVCLALNLRFICQRECIIEYQDSYVCLTCNGTNHSPSAILPNLQVVYIPQAPSVRQCHNFQIFPYT